MTTLKLDWCSHEAAKYAVEHWHYSRSMPAGKSAKVGVWEGEQFKGAVIFALGAQQNLGTMFGLTMFQCSELVRVALTNHIAPVSRILSIALKMFKKQSPGVRLIISYADCDQGHHGGIYAAGGWVYLGMTQLDGGTPKFKVNGVVMHGRSVHSRWGSGSQRLEWLRAHVDPKAEKIFTAGKHKYAYPLDDAMRKQIAPLAKPYPKRVTRGTGEIDSAPHSNGETGGASPTVPL